MRKLILCLPLLASSCDIYITPNQQDAEWMRRCREALDAYCADEDGDAHTTSTRFTEAIPDEDEQRAFCEDRRAKLETQYFYVPDCVDGDDCDTLPKYKRLAPCSAGEDEDCDDSNASVFPGQSDGDVECDGVDGDCDGEVDEDGTATTLWYPDADGDGYGDANEAESGVETVGCESPEEGLVMNADDCVDDDSSINPTGVDTICSDGKDMDCDGQELCALDGTVDLTELGAMYTPKTDGIAVASGDADDDGIPDLVVVGYDGKVEVLGGDSIFEPSDSGGFGSAVAVGDWDGGGSLDLAVGAPNSHVVVLVDSTGIETGRFDGKEGAEKGGAVLASVWVDEEPDGLAAVSRTEYDTTTEKETWAVYYLGSVNSGAIMNGSTKIGSFDTNLDWPLSLTASRDGTMLAVGYSAVNSLGTGCNLYTVSNLTTPLATATTTTTTSYLGASVFVSDIDDSGEPDLLCGAPGADILYLLTDIASNTSVSEATPSWRGDTGTGAGVALVNSLNGDEYPELVIGAENTLYLLYGPEFSTGSLNSSSIASAKVTGFDGPVKQIVSAGDLDNDTYNDMLVTDGINAYILYGGPP